MKFHPIRKDHGGKLWCGLAALSTVSGFGTRYCLDHIKESSKEIGFGPRRVMGIYYDEIIQAFHHLSYKTEPLVKFKARDPLAPNLIQWIFDTCNRKSTLPEGIILIADDTHYMVTDGRILVCSVRPEGCDISEHPHWRRKMHAAWMITEVKCEDL